MILLSKQTIEKIIPEAFYSREQLQCHCIEEGLAEVDKGLRFPVPLDKGNEGLGTRDVIEGGPLRLDYFVLHGRLARNVNQVKQNACPSCSK